MKHTAQAVPRRSALKLGAAAALWAVAGRSWGQDAYPSKPIKLVVPFGAGSSSDILARAYAKVVAELAGQPLVVENRGGGDGIIAARGLIGAPADGYSIMFASNTLLSTNAVAHKGLAYDPLKDFDPVSVLQVSFAAVAVPASSKFQTFDDLVAFARKNPGALSHGSGSSTYTLWNVWLTKLLNISSVNIPYKDSGGAAQAVASGQVDYAVTAAPPLLPLVDSGRVRILLYSGNQRHPHLPNVPTAKEYGLKDYEALIWNAVAVKAGTPAAVRDRIVEYFRKASQSEEILNRIKAQGYVVEFSGPDRMREFQREEIARWRKLIADTGLKFE